MKDTETLDKLYLEWSQFTKAKTEREILLKEALSQIQRFASTNFSSEHAAYINQVVNHAFQRGALR